LARFFKCFFWDFSLQWRCPGFLDPLMSHAGGADDTEKMLPAGFVSTLLVLAAGVLTICVLAG
jgi:hypothetical protein